MFNTLDSANLERTRRFLHYAGRLKTLRRRGWQVKGIRGGESVADHTFRVSIMALFLSRQNGSQLNREKCMALAIVHDLAESIVGDFTPHDEIPADAKRGKEKHAIRELSSMLGDSELTDLWIEFEEGTSPEAAFVRDLDRIEAVVQALEYEREKGTDLSEFWDSLRPKLEGEWARAFFDELISARRSQR